MVQIWPFTTKQKKSELAKKLRSKRDIEKFRKSSSLDSPTIAFGSVTIVNPVYRGPNPYRGPELSDPKNAGKVFIAIRQPTSSPEPESSPPLSQSSEIIHHDQQPPLHPRKKRPASAAALVAGDALAAIPRTLGRFIDHRKRNSSDDRRTPCTVDPQTQTQMAGQEEIGDPFRRMSPEAERKRV